MTSGIRVPVVASRSRFEVERIASEFLRDHAPYCLQSPQPSPVLRFFDRVLPSAFGFKPMIDELPPGLEGITDMGVRSVTLPPEVYAGLEEGMGRALFTASHEIGHVVLHAAELSRTGTCLPNTKAITLARRTDILPYQDPEWQANYFASALIMPVIELMQLEREHGVLTVTLLVETFSVSAAAARTRLKTYAENREKLQRVGRFFAKI